METLEVSADETVVTEEVSQEREESSQDKEILSWIMRSWFDKEKHKGKPWYSSDVTEATVLEYISNKSNFPFSMNQIVELWNNKKYLKRVFHSENLEELLDSAQKSVPQNQQPKTTYKKGEETLSSICDDVGGVSVTIVKKIGDQAEEKIKKIYDNKSPFDLTPEEEGILLGTIDEARIETAQEYAEMLKASPDVKSFIDTLISNQILTPNEISLVSLDEIQSLNLLHQKDKEVIIDVLLEDIDTDNVFKTFQNAISRKLFPSRKRGRPRKTR